MTSEPFTILTTVAPIRSSVVSSPITSDINTFLAMYRKRSIRLFRVATGSQVYAKGADSNLSALTARGKSEEFYHKGGCWVPPLFTRFESDQLGRKHVIQ